MLRYILLVMVIGVHCEARCQFSSSLVYPCDCLHNQIQCYGKKIDENVLTAIFANITAKTDDYLHNLQGLELINTKIKSINSSMFGSVQINSFLRVSNNHLANFSIGNFNKLVLLDVSNNVFDHVGPNTFIGLNQLAVLHAANIGLQMVTKEYFSHLKNLEKLDLSGNNINRIQQGSFSSEYENNFQLKEIDLSFNQLEYLPDNIFLVLRQPRLINLASNKLKSVDEVFKFSSDIIQFESIQIILSNNSLMNDHFNNQTFQHLISRNHFINLDLSCNKLTWLDEDVLGPLFKKDARNVINMEHNPMQCSNCRNKWLFSENNTKLVSSVIKTTCIEGDKSLQSYSLTDFEHCNTKPKL